VRPEHPGRELSGETRDARRPKRPGGDDDLVDFDVVAVELKQEPARR
jgi:hypothetical protein